MFSQDIFFFQFSCKNVLSVVDDYFCKDLRLRCLWGFWLGLCSSCVSSNDIKGFQSSFELNWYVSFSVPISMASRMPDALQSLKMIFLPFPLISVYKLIICTAYSSSITVRDVLVTISSILISLSNLSLIFCLHHFENLFCLWNDGQSQELTCKIQLFSTIQNILNKECSFFFFHYKPQFLWRAILTHFLSMFPFYTPWKH